MSPDSTYAATKHIDRYILNPKTVQGAFSHPFFFLQNFNEKFHLMLFNEFVSKTDIDF